MIFKHSLWKDCKIRTWCFHESCTVSSTTAYTHCTVAASPRMQLKCIQTGNQACGTLFWKLCLITFALWHLANMCWVTVLKSQVGCTHQLDTVMSGKTWNLGDSCHMCTSAPAWDGKTALYCLVVAWLTTTLLSMKKLVHQLHTWHMLVMNHTVSATELQQSLVALYQNQACDYILGNGWPKAFNWLIVCMFNPQMAKIQGERFLSPRRTMLGS